MTEIIESIGKAIMGAYEYCNTPHILEAIWATKAIWLIDDGELKRTVRLTKGQLVHVNVHKHFTHISPEGEKEYLAGDITDVTESTPANFRILATFGASTHSFSIKIEELKTCTHYYIKL